MLWVMVFTVIAAIMLGGVTAMVIAGTGYRRINRPEPLDRYDTWIVPTEPYRYNPWKDELLCLSMRTRTLFMPS